jgi:predicted Zn-dependent peptidase
VFDAISKILGRGRTSRLYKSLVKEKKIAVGAGADFGRRKYPGLFTIYVMPAKGHTPDECEKAVYAEIEKLKTEPVSAEELQKAKIRSRADVIGQLDSNPALASRLTFYEVLTGDWRNLLGQFDKINQVNAEDVQRVAKEYFVTENRTVGVIRTTTTEN